MTNFKDLTVDDLIGSLPPGAKINMSGAAHMPSEDYDELKERLWDTQKANYPDLNPQDLASLPLGERVRLKREAQNRKQVQFE